MKRAPLLLQAADRALKAAGIKGQASRIDMEAIDIATSEDGIARRLKLGSAPRLILADGREFPCAIIRRGRGERVSYEVRLRGDEA